MAVAAKGCLKKAGPGTGAGSCLFEDHCGTPVWWQLFYEKEESPGFTPSRKSGYPNVIDMYRKPLLEWVFLLHQEKCTRTEASCDLWNSQPCAGGIRHQLTVCLRGKWKALLQDTLFYWHDWVNWIFSCFSSLQKYSIISLVTYSLVFLTHLITVFKIIGLNCSFTLIHFWDSIPKDKAACRRMFTAALIIFKSGEVKCATKEVFK